MKPKQGWKHGDPQFALPTLKDKRLHLTPKLYSEGSALHSKLPVARGKGKLGFAFTQDSLSGGNQGPVSVSQAPDACSTRWDKDPCISWYSLFPGGENHQVLMDTPVYRHPLEQTSTLLSGTALQ